MCTVLKPTYCHTESRCLYDIMKGSRNAHYFTPFVFMEFYIFRACLNFIVTIRHEDSRLVTARKKQLKYDINRTIFGLHI